MEAFCLLLDQFILSIYSWHCIVGGICDENTMRFTFRYMPSSLHCAVVYNA